MMRSESVRNSGYVARVKEKLRAEIKKEMKNKEVTQRMLAKALKTSQSRVCGVLSDENKKASISVLITYLAYFGRGVRTMKIEVPDDLV